jgi:transposase
VSSWTLPDLCRWIEERFDKRLPPQSLSRILRREGFSRQKTRPTHPKIDEQAQRRFEKDPMGRGVRPPGRLAAPATPS